MLNFNPYLNYQQRLMQMEQQQPLQPMQSYTPQMQAMFVSGVDDLNKLQIMPNVVYIGINKALKEVYIKQMNYDGLTEFNTYSLASEKQEKGNAIQSRDFQLSQLAQNETLISRLQPTPKPAYITCSPYQAQVFGLNGFNGCGCGY